MTARAAEEHAAELLQGEDGAVAVGGRALDGVGEAAAGFDRLWWTKGTLVHGDHGRSRGSALGLNSKVV